ncbi:unnamed protein product, partial [Prorocentrum cordatum]
MKPAPGKDVTRQLWENYLKDGFVTSGEPLLVSQPEELQVRPEPPLPAPTAHAPHSLGYIKGQARSLALLALLHYCYSKNIDLKEVHPLLWQSVCRIYALKVTYSTKADEALANMKLSARGSIRRANNLVVTVVMLHNLSKQGFGDLQSFARSKAFTDFAAAAQEAHSHDTGPSIAPAYPFKFEGTCDCAWNKNQKDLLMQHGQGQGDGLSSRADLQRNA